MKAKINFEEMPDIGGLGEKSLHNILRSMISGIEGSKSQLYDVYESAKAEVETSTGQLQAVKREMEAVRREADELCQKEQEGRHSLIRVSSNFSDYSERRIHEAYDFVRDIQVRLGVAREREKQLKKAEARLEARIIHLRRTVRGAERLAIRISSMLSYLCSQISDVVSQLEAASKSRFLSAAIIQAQEEERLRVSREIHDGPAQDIAAMMTEASISERLIDIDPDEAKMSLQGLRRHLKECLGGIRQIIFDMRPMSLDDLGLVAAVEQFVRQFRERGLLSVAMIVEGEESELPRHVKAALFRIIQESLSNIVHHANTRRATLRILFTVPAVSILVEDHGDGFDEDELSGRPSYDAENRHFGVIGMKERATIIGAELSITSKKGRGTRVHLRLPLHPEEGAPETPEEAAKSRSRAPRKKVVYDEHSYAVPDGTTDAPEVWPDVIPEGENE